MDSRRENWTSEELTINNTTSAASFRQSNLPISQDVSPSSDFSVPNNSTALSSVTEYSQSSSVDVFTRPHFEGSHLTPGLTIPTQLPMDNTRESQTMDGSTLNNMTYTFGLEDGHLLNHNSTASACFESERSFTSLSSICDSSQSPDISFLPSFDFRGPRLTSGANIPPQLSMNDRRDDQTVGDSAVTDVTMMFGPQDVPLSRENPHGLIGLFAQYSASTHLSRVNEYSHSPGMNFPLRCDFDFSPGVKIRSQLPMDYSGYTQGESTVINMIGEYSSSFPLSQDSCTPSTSFAQFSSSASSSRNANYSLPPSMPSLTGFDIRSSQMTSGVNRSPQLPTDNRGESQTLGESTVNTSTGLCRPVNFPARPAVPLLRRVSAPQRTFHPVLCNRSSWSRVGGCPKSGGKRKRMSPGWSGQDPKQTKLTSTTVDSSVSDNVNPPPLSFRLPKQSDLPPKCTMKWEDVSKKLPIDILLLVVEDSEFLACYHYLDKPFKSYHSDIGYFYLRLSGDLKVALVKCCSGAAVPGGSLTVVKDAVRALRPKAVFSVGACSGLNRQKARLGDVVVSSKLTTGGYKTPPSRHFNNLIKHAADGWNPPIADPNSRKVKVHSNGEILSSQSDAIREEIMWKQNPKAVAVEMEGEGVFAAAHGLNTEWIIIKGIKDYVGANQTLGGEWRDFASVMAASVVAKILSDPVVFQEWSHFNQEVCAVNSFDLKTCQRKLAEHYQRTAKIPTTVWSSTIQENLDDIYNRLSLVKGEQTRAGVSGKEMGHYTEMFTEKSNSGAPKKRILVQGDTGIGKTTFVKKMLLDLSNLDEAQLDEEQKNALRRFDLVLAVDLKEVSQCQTFTEVLCSSSLFPEDNKSIDDLSSYILTNEEKILLVFDGYDEYRTGSKGDEQSDELEGSADIQAEVTGFNLSDRKVYMMKILKNEAEVSELFNFLEYEDMEDLARVPLLNLFFCLLWEEEKEKLKDGTKSKTKLYQAIVRFILQHSRRRRSPPQASMVKEEYYQDILAEIGKVALEGLLKGDLVFEYDKLSAAVRGEKSVLAGLLQLSEHGPSVEPKRIVSFIHKSIQEYLAAWYVTNRCVPEGNLGGIEEHVSNWERCKEFKPVFQFICGLSDEGAGKILEHVKSVRISNPEVDYSRLVPDFQEETCKSQPDITLDHEKFNYLLNNCFEEVQSKAELLDLFFDCFGRVVRVISFLLSILEKMKMDHNISPLIHSDVKFDFSWSFQQLVVAYPDNLLKLSFLTNYLDCGDTIVKIGESAESITLKDFLEEGLKEIDCSCTFNFILCFHKGQYQFYVTELILRCNHHAKLFIGTTASSAQSRSRDWSSEQSCLQFLRVLECDILSGDKSFQFCDMFCDVMQSVPNPNNCLLKVSLPRIDEEDYEEYRLTTAKVEKLSRSLRPFTRIERFALDVNNCSAAAVETLLTSVTRATLKELDLQGITLTPAVATALCRLLPETPSLRILSLTEIYVSNIRAEEMFIELIDRALRSPLLFNFNLNLV
ncbi:NACHT, LRR and PYD domains-containing protein 3 [Stylophora pistillata]|uniref:NACHT, LRR and PYD domains-containing protein 3 n=1 Tax=Stylophora pistillata TaxID=50429 RepID=A0A2B4S5R3_STYPI|nr:NACHT, LRR and PYD domains-containing protein 3 [Stylophora pistillata]